MLIYIDFRDKDLQALIVQIDQQLVLFGLDPATDLVPADAIACALDEVRAFSDPKARANILHRLERFFTRRRSFMHHHDQTRRG